MSGVGLLVASATLTLGHPGNAATAVDMACHGQPATIVGAPGQDIDGTDGPDVIVTNGSEVTMAGGGDDLVCVTGGADLDERSHLQVIGEDGNDQIDASANLAPAMLAHLGPGDDTYLGGPGSDQVQANDPWGKDPGEGADTITTGAGRDFVETGSRPGTPDQDAVDLGPDHDHLWVQGVVDESHPMLGGTGNDELGFDRYSVREAMVINNDSGSATVGGTTVMAWDSFETFSISHIGPYEPPSFVGGPGRERLRAGIPLTSVDMGGGDDTVNIHVHDQAIEGASYDGGDGKDSFTFNAGAGDQAERVKLHLPQGRMLFQPETRYTTPSEPVRARIHGFERYRVSAEQMDIVGTKAPDHIEWLGCKGVIDGRGGDDLIQEFSSADVGCGYLDEDGQEIVRGGPGDDILSGALAPNTLIGGGGVDFANGGGSKRDRCVAEQTQNCEL